MSALNPEPTSAVVKSPSEKWPESVYEVSAGLSQNDLIEEALFAKLGEWIPMPELARIGSGNDGFCMVHSRVAELRKRGLVIEQRSERQGAKIHSFYRLIP
jgi:hypothetical protein